jgi:hypothetical protein
VAPRQDLREFQMDPSMRIRIEQLHRWPRSAISRLTRSCKLGPYHPQFALVSVTREKQLNCRDTKSRCVRAPSVLEYLTEQ